jgi:hypothetical protein
MIALKMLGQFTSMQLVPFAHSNLTYGQDYIAITDARQIKMASSIWEMV